MRENLFKEFLFKNAILKITALIFAIALWFLVAGEKKVEVGFLINLEFKNLPKDMEVVGEPVHEIEVRAVGSKAFIVNLSPAHLSAVIDVSNATPGINNINIEPDDISAPKGVEIVKINPSIIQLYLEPVISKSVPVKVDISGKPASGYSIKNISVTPDSVVLFGTRDKLEGINEVWTAPMDVSEIKSDKTQILPLRMDVGLKRLEPDRVDVKVFVESTNGRR